MQTIENIWNITDKEEIEEDILIILRFQWKYMNATNVAKEEIQEILKESNWSKSLHFMQLIYGISGINSQNIPYEMVVLQHLNVVCIRRPI